MRGTVVIDFIGNAADNIYILNKTQNLYTTTNLAGHFSIQAKAKDTLIFKGSFLQERNFVVNPWALQQENVIIHMNNEKIKLKELVVKPKLTGYIEKDIKTVHKDDTKEKLYASLGLNIHVLDLEPKEKVSPLFSSILTLDVISVIKHLNGHYRKLENLQAYEKYAKKISTIKAFLGTKFFVNTIGIPEKDIEQFLIFAENNQTQRFNLYFEEKSYLSLSVLLQSEATEFKKRLLKRGH